MSKVSLKFNEEEDDDGGSKVDVPFFVSVVELWIEVVSLWCSAIFSSSLSSSLLPNLAAESGCPYTLSHHNRSLPNSKTSAWECGDSFLVDCVSPKSTRVLCSLWDCTLRLGERYSTKRHTHLSLSQCEWKCSWYLLSERNGRNSDGFVSATHTGSGRVSANWISFDTFSGYSSMTSLARSQNILLCCQSKVQPLASIPREMSCWLWSCTRSICVRETLPESWSHCQTDSEEGKPRALKGKSSWRQWWDGSWEILVICASSWSQRSHLCVAHKNPSDSPSYTSNSIHSLSLICVHKSQPLPDWRSLRHNIVPILSDWAFLPLSNLPNVSVWRAWREGVMKKEKRGKEKERKKKRKSKEERKGKEKQRGKKRKRRIEASSCSIVDFLFSLTDLT